MALDTVFELKLEIVKRLEAQSTKIYWMLEGLEEYGQHERPSMHRNLG
jgi:hypothetical protein